MKEIRKRRRREPNDRKRSRHNIEKFEILIGDMIKKI